MLATESAVDQVRDLSGGGVHHAFEAVGKPSTSLAALRITRTGGRTYLIGVHKTSSSLILDVNRDLFDPQRTITAINMGASNFRVDVERYFQLLTAGPLNLEGMVMQRVRLDQIEQGYRWLLDGDALVVCLQNR